MRYYVYISDWKLEMLYEQVPVDKRKKIAAQLSINLGLINTRFQSETVANARHQKIQIVQKHLGAKAGEVGERKSYIYGKIKAAWGPFHQYPNIVYFGGHGNGCHIGLMGSHANCLGSEGLAKPTGYSSSLYIVGLLSRRKCIPSLGYTGVGYMSAKSLEEAACRGVVVVNTCSIDFTTEIEFLFRVICYKEKTEEDPYRVYVGSPIYVAECDYEI